MQELRERDAAYGQQVETVALEPLGMAAGVHVPVDDRHLRMAPGHSREGVVHADVRVSDLAQRRPQDAPHARPQQRLDGDLDARGERLLRVVVAHGDEDRRAQRGAHRLHELEQSGRRRALENAARPRQPAAYGDLQPDVEVLLEDDPRRLVPEDAREHRVPDHRHLRRRARGGRTRRSRHEDRTRKCRHAEESHPQMVRRELPNTQPGFAACAGARVTARALGWRRGAWSSGDRRRQRRRGRGRLRPAA